MDTIVHQNTAKQVSDKISYIEVMNDNMDLDNKELQESDYDNNSATNFKISLSIK